MTQELRVVEAIKHSGVKRVAIVDDAFDPPTLVEGDWGSVLTFLEAANASLIRDQAGISPGLWDAAIRAVRASEYDSDELLDWLEALYAVYVDTFDSKFDPGEKFKTTKGTNLGNVRPLISLIRSCKPEIEIQTFGFSVGDMAADKGAHVVFVDLFLDANIGAADEPSVAVGKSAVQASLERIEPLMGLSPSVILMSSHSGREEAKNYRDQIKGGSVYASRFAFIDKTKITKLDGKSIQVAHEAGDALLDIFQSYKFGRGLHQTLEAWMASAKEAVEKLAGEIERLELRDIAYLVRFRLASEGQSLPEYLEWLLAECLVDEVGKRLDARARSPEIAHLTNDEAARIEGAFDGPTKNVADLYHRVRIEDKRINPREHFRLGDVYLRKDSKGREDLIAVMNPDCDLVSRKGERATSSMLTVRGELQEFDAPQTSVGDFIVIGGRPRNIRWDYKAIQTLPFMNTMSGPGKSEDGHTYLGALRPMYAQEIQANLLNQLGRVGVAVPPALAFAASVRLTYLVGKDGEKKALAIDGAEETQCYFVPARQSEKVGRAVFKRKFVRDFLATIGKIDAGSLKPEAAKRLAALNTAKAEAKLVGLTSAGLELEETICFGVVLTAKEKFKPSGETWCWLTLSMASSAVDSATSLDQVLEVAPVVSTQGAASSAALAVPIPETVGETTPEPSAETPPAIENITGANGTPPADVGPAT